jgi:hypothetical protein
MGWTDEERLVVVVEQGFIQIVDMEGSSTQIFLGEVFLDFFDLQDAKVGILDAVIRGSTVVIMTIHFQFIAIADIDEPRAKALPDMRLTERPGCWDVLPNHLSLSNHLEVFVSIRTSIFVLDPAAAQDQVFKIKIHSSSLKEDLSLKCPYHQMEVF